MLLIGYMYSIVPYMLHVAYPFTQVLGVGVMVGANFIWCAPGMKLCEEHDHECSHWRQISDDYNFTTGLPLIHDPDHT